MKKNMTKKSEVLARISKKGGFTLIELLVVIAIIGILAGIILVSLNGARAKAKDAAIKSQLSALRAQGEIFADDNGSAYTGFCADAETVRVQTKVVADGGSFNCDETASAWAAESAMVSTTGDPFYCVDSAGNSRSISATKVDAVVCPAS